jgi:hypothetical protein
MIAVSAYRLKPPARQTRRARIGARSVLALSLLTLLYSAPATPAQADTTVCIPDKTGKPIVAGTEVGGCTNTKTVTYQPLRLPSGTSLATLSAILPYLSFNSSGVGGMPTVRVVGANLQLLNGSGSTETTNGAGNLVIGYDASPQQQTGSHNLVMGRQVTFTSYSGIANGHVTSLTGPYAAVLTGEFNTAGELSAVIGGRGNAATGLNSVISGGFNNNATGSNSWIGGGETNLTETNLATIAGGDFNVVAGAEGGSVTGGELNRALGFRSSIAGGHQNVASGVKAFIGGGFKNAASGELSSILGGKEATATKAFETIP